MDKETRQQFTFRISQATKSELVVILYDMILSDMSDAQSALKAGEEAEITKALQHAVQCLNELMGTLDFRYELSVRLRSLYIYAERELIHTMMKRELSSLDHVMLVIQGLRQAFYKVSKEDRSEPLMKNTQQVYAGLTYGKGVLKETSLDANEANRGFYA